MCVIEGCDRPILIKSTGLCDAHRKRLERHGTATGGGVSREVHPRVRYLEQTEAGEGGCILWTGATVTPAKSGGLAYGRFKVDGKNVLVHRWVYTEATGTEIPPGAVIRNTCDVSLCVNPDHLLLGSHADNVRDCIERGRAWWQKNA